MNKKSGIYTNIESEKYDEYHNKKSYDLIIREKILLEIKLKIQKKLYLIT